MAINFPSSLDNLTNPQSSDTLDNPSHSTQHINENDIIEALEAKVGIDSSGVSSSHDYKISALEGNVGQSLNTNDNVTFADLNFTGTLKSSGSQISASDLSDGTGISDNNILLVDDADAADNDYAKFTANGLEGRSYSEIKTDLSLNNVENTAISTWTGTSNITTLGIIETGTWQGNDVAVGYLDGSSGTNGQVLTSDGTNASWQDASGGVDTSGTPVDNDFAKFTDANTIEGRSYSEVLGDLSGHAGANFSMNSKKITALADPSSNQDAMTKKYWDDNKYADADAVSAAKADADISDAISKKHTQGTDTALGAQAENLDMNSHKVVDVTDPTTDQDAATKKYVDDHYKGYHTCDESISFGSGSWQDIDLSGTVGANAVLAIIKCYASSGNDNGWIQFMNADESDVDGGFYDQFEGGASKVLWDTSGSGSTSDLIYLMCPTNASGVIKGLRDTGDVSFTLVGWIG